MINNRVRVLALDDESNILLAIETALQSHSIDVDCFLDCESALRSMHCHVYDCALIDIRIGKENGIDFFKKMRAQGISVPVIFISGNSSLSEAVESQKLGAYDFIEKPFSADKLHVTIVNCIDFFRLKNKLELIRPENENSRLVGEDKSMLLLKSAISKVAKTDAAVLIHGESGTGKELIAAEIHAASSRCHSPLVTVNCSAIPENLVGNSLFGHKKGAFTGASDAKKGYFEVAHKGTIFLDEIGDMPETSQASLLRVLETKEIQKVGSETTTKVDVRIIAATHKDLKQAVEDGRFRQDLYYRLSVIPIESPTLRERLADLEILVDHLLARICKRHGIPVKNIHPNCLKVFKRYDWPGNVRELANTLERMVIMGGESLEVEDIPSDIGSALPSVEKNGSLKALKHQLEKETILYRLQQFDGNISQVARSLDIDRTNLHKKLKMHNIRRENEFSGD